ncbi:MAG: tRNA lysidine(34) synthetase TilS [Lachnospiraceae bacterium]|nr:tRNA lysidine(34) synthetase TilS [Lachnospiraceae bacterium]
MNKFENTILSYIREKNMLTAGMAVTVAVSGGADSVCLLTVLHRLQRVLKITLHAVHVDHMLRGEEAAKDAAFVRALCDSLNVPFTLHRIDVAAYAKEHAMSLEEAGREVRYAALRGESARHNPSRESAGTGTLTHFPQHGEQPDSFVKMSQCTRPPDSPASVASRIATAHTATDQAETVLLNLFRGSGLTGAAGMLPVNGDIIRPLLNTTREEIEDYLRAEHIAWREDATNEDDDYTRNRIRHHILPVAAREINARAVQHLAQAAETFAEADALIAAMACESARHNPGRESAGTGTLTHFSPRGEQPVQSEPKRVSVPVPLTHSARILQEETIRQALAGVTPHRKDITRKHIDAILHLCRNNHGVKSLDLPSGVKVVRDHDTLTFLPDSTEGDR